MSETDDKEQARKELKAKQEKLEREEAKKEVSEATKEVAPGADPAVIAATVAAVLEKMQPQKERSEAEKVRTLYPLDAKNYESPVDRLMDAPEFKRLAMHENYKMEWKVEMTKYQVADGSWVQQPQLMLKLLRRPTEEELADSIEKGGSISSDDLIEEGLFVQFEDDVAALEAARRLGLEIGKDFENVEQLMNEMRFERFKRSLMDKLLPPTPTEQINAPRELAVSGRVVKVHRTAQGPMVESEKILR